MAKRTRDWAWRRLLGASGEGGKRPMDIEEKRTEGEVVML